MVYSWKSSFGYMGDHSHPNLSTGCLKRLQQDATDATAGDKRTPWLSCRLSGAYASSAWLSHSVSSTSRTLSERTMARCLPSLVEFVLVMIKVNYHADVHINVLKTTVATPGQHGAPAGEGSRAQPPPALPRSLPAGDRKSVV